MIQPNMFAPASVVRLVMTACAFSSALALVACDNNAAEAQKQSAAQASALSQSAVATEAAASAVTSRETDVKAKEADLKSREVQLSAERKVFEASVAFNKVRDDYRQATQKTLTEIDKKIGELLEKAKTATGQAKTDLEAKLKLVQPSRDAFAADVEAIEKSLANTWEDTKIRVDKAWKAVKEALEKA